MPGTCWSKAVALGKTGQGFQKVAHFVPVEGLSTSFVGGAKPDMVGTRLAYLAARLAVLPNRAELAGQYVGRVVSFPAREALGGAKPFLERSPWALCARRGGGVGPMRARRARLR